MMKTKTLKVNYYRNSINGRDFNAKPLLVNGKYNCICNVYLKEYYYIPKSAEEITGIISNKPFNECYKISLRSPTSDYINIHINDDRHKKVIFYMQVIYIITKFMKANKLEYAYVGVEC